MTGLVLALVGAYGMHLLFTALAFQWRGLAPGPSLRRRVHSTRWRDWFVQAGLDDTRPRELVAVEGALALLGAGLAWALFGGVVPPLADRKSVV